MNEGDEGIAFAWSRGLVDQPQSVFFQLGQCLHDVIDDEGDVVKPWTTFLDELMNR